MVINDNGNIIWTPLFPLYLQPPSRRKKTNRYSMNALVSNTKILVQKKIESSKKKFTITFVRNVHPTTCYRCHKQMIKNQCRCATGTFTCYLRWKCHTFVFIAIAQHISFSISKFHYTLTLTHTYILKRHTAHNYIHKHHTHIIMQSKICMCRLYALAQIHFSRHWTEIHEVKWREKM